MAEVSGFKHISVSADSDDDVVIWAGTEQASAEVRDSALVNEVPDSAPVNQDALEGLGGSAKPAPAPMPVKRTAQSGDEDLGYRETTLDDLKSEPMSKTQKIIIACAIAAVAAAVVYYFVFMR